MHQTRFTNIRLILQEASELFDEGRITVDEFEKLVEGVETDYHAIVLDMDTKEMSELLLNYFNRSKTD